MSSAEPRSLLDPQQSDTAAITAAVLTIGSGQDVFASAYSVGFPKVNLAGVSVAFTGTDPLDIAKLNMKDGSFNGATTTTDIYAGGDLGRIVAHGLVVDTGSIDVSGNPEAAGHLDIRIASDSAFVQQGGIDLFYGGSITVTGAPSATFINNATLDSTGGILDIQTNLSGTGTIIDGVQVAGQSGDVELGGVVQSGETVDMSGSVGLLQLDRPQSFLGTISDFNGLDRIMMHTTPVTAAMFDANDDLLLFHKARPTDSLHFANPPPTLYVSNLGAGAGVAILGSFGAPPPGSITVHPHAIG